MIDKLRRVWARLRVEGNEAVVTPDDVQSAFELQFDGLRIGVLSISKGLWTFEYTPEFRAQSEVRPLVDFPDVGKTYVNAELWPFFLARIPSLSQPQVQATLDREGIDSRNAVALLRRFGERTIANPFVLQTAP